LQQWWKAANRVNANTGCTCTRELSPDINDKWNRDKPPASQAPQNTATVNKCYRKSHRVTLCSLSWKRAHTLHSADNSERLLSYGNPLRATAVCTRPWHNDETTAAVNIPVWFRKPVENVGAYVDYVSGIKPYWMLCHCKFVSFSQLKNQMIYKHLREALTYHTPYSKKQAFQNS
jgi:hypothetical protein